MRILVEVAEGLARGTPVVALETSVLAHGLPRPDNLQAVHAMLAAVRASGAVPAVIGVLDGEVRIGLEDEALERFATGSGIAKASERDIGVLVGLGGSGATTVAGTAASAARAGIRVMATGGIGGVHRGGDRSFDVSADLLALARHPVAVVCSGAKSILDLPRTMEVLETVGVPVIGFRTRRWPGFHVAETDIELEHAVTSVAEAARVARAHFAHHGAGLVIANPVPAHAALAADQVEAWVAAARRAALAASVRGKAETPFLLDHLARSSRGATLAANVALLESNAALAGAIAAALGDAGV